MRPILSLFLLALLLFFISATIAYEFDGGLKASHYCIEHGETKDCFKIMETAK